MYAKLIVLTGFLFTLSASGLEFSEIQINAYRREVVDMFYHAYEGYLKYAYPYDELRPLSCDGHDTWGQYSLTLIDALDTLVVLGNFSEFHRAADRILERSDFNHNYNVSVFETNIRIVGGLLSAHLLSKRASYRVEPGWPCSGPLLNLAERVARRLLPAFNTSTGMPYGTVNLRFGVPVDETSVTSTAGVGTFIVEFGALSRLTGDPVFEETALRALRSLWLSKSELNLVGNHIDVATGRWTATDAGVGASVDSYFEYLVKGAVLFNKPDLLQQFHTLKQAIDRYVYSNGMFHWVNMNDGKPSLTIAQSLDAFWPGLLSVVGQVDEGLLVLHKYHALWRRFGFIPEFYSIPKQTVITKREGYPLRPEHAESLMYLYRATKDPELLKMGADMVRSISLAARTKCGFSTVKDVTNHRKEDKMESFFLAETVKYLYLLFDENNFLHNDGRSALTTENPAGSCLVDSGFYVFNTEAHPIDGAALFCCHARLEDRHKLLRLVHGGGSLMTAFAQRVDESSHAELLRVPSLRANLVELLRLANASVSSHVANKHNVSDDAEQTDTADASAASEQAIAVVQQVTEVLHAHRRDLRSLRSPALSTTHSDAPHDHLIKPPADERPNVTLLIQQLTHLLDDVLDQTDQLESNVVRHLFANADANDIQHSLRWQSSMDNLTCFTRTFQSRLRFNKFLFE